MKQNKTFRSLLSVFLTLVMLFQVALPIFAAGVDSETASGFTNFLGDNASTEYAGRIWTDRSVHSSDVVFHTFGGGTATVKINEGRDDEEFLISYSALSTTHSVVGKTQSPVDVVFIIDVSGSMKDSMGSDSNQKRIAVAAQSLNKSIDTILGLNDYTRVGVVAFSENAVEFLPLGRYEKGSRNGISNYFSVNFSGDTLYRHCTEEKTGRNFGGSVAVSGGTNIQCGLSEGMQLLANENSTTVDVNGSLVRRTPSVVILSDGAPTFSSDSVSWWNPADNDDDGNGSDPYYGNGLKALMTGAYMKEAINRNYDVSGTAFSTTVYSVGIGISSLVNSVRYHSQTYYTGEKDLAYMTLNPKGFWSANNSMSNSIVSAWNQYLNSTSVSVSVNYGDSYMLTHPTQNDIASDPDALKNFVDSYYDADNASALEAVFSSIVDNISISAPQVPTEMKSNDPMTDGYITYTDPIGEYMEVKDVKAIIYAGTKFTQKTVSEANGITSYVFSGEAHSPLYGEQNIAHILITVEEKEGKQTLVIKIPAGVIPVRVNEVVLNKDGTVQSHTNNGAFPARVVYSVGFDPEILRVSDDGHRYVDSSKISADYLAANTNADGTVNFFGTIYTGNQLVNGHTAGDATVEFEPAHSNPFYYVQEDTPIYWDAEFEKPVTAAEGLKDDTVYYFKDVHYHGSSVEVSAVARTGAQLKKTSVIAGVDGNLYREKGSLRLNRMLEFEGLKSQNTTKTAETYYSPTFVHASGSDDPYEGKIVVYLGNNGVASLPVGGHLSITKTVSADSALTPPDASFVFTIDLNGETVNQGTYRYEITDENGQKVGEGSISAQNPTVTLKANQTATVFNLAPKTAFTVTETIVGDGFSLEKSDGAVGTIHAGQTQKVSFSNRYSVSSVSFEDLEGKKVLDGRGWQEGDLFSFRLYAVTENAPLPEGYDSENGITVSAPDVVGGDTASFDFGSIVFQKPGVYEYHVVEKEAENDGFLPGVSYSRALYCIKITVVDDGKGNLVIEKADSQKLRSDDGNRLYTVENGEMVMNQGEEAQDSIFLFVNTFSVDDVFRVPVAIKNYFDLTGTRPLQNGMFSFRLEAIGTEAVNGGISRSAVGVPMPADSVNGVAIAKNEGNTVTFLPIHFTQDMIPQNATSVTFFYKLSEIIPDTIEKGMVYDDTYYTVKLILSLEFSENSAILDVNANCYLGDYEDNNAARVPQFNNYYSAQPTLPVQIFGNKVLNGRDMLEGELYEFVLSGGDNITAKAMEDGVVMLRSDTASVEGGKNGVKVPFSFDGIIFNQPGTYRFHITEKAGNAPSVKYDGHVEVVTVVVEDRNGQLVVVTNSNENKPAEFVNEYSAQFYGNGVSLEGTKTLTGKTLLEGEFYFNVSESFNSQLIRTFVVSHSGDLVGENGVYSGTVSILKNAVYSAEGTYRYMISEQIPVTPVGGTTYDKSVYRFTVVVADTDKQGRLTVVSTVLERQKADGSWEQAEKVLFENKYVPNAVTATVPLIKKEIDGGRSTDLKADEFSFEMKVVSATFADGIQLPNRTVVGNAANGDVVFGEITFTKEGTYVVSVKEVIPPEEDRVPGILYSEQLVVATFVVKDLRNGVLTVSLSELDGGETITNLYRPKTASVDIEIVKIFTGRENDAWLPTDFFDFEIVINDEATKNALANGDIEFVTDSEESFRKTFTLKEKDQKVLTSVKINKPGIYRFQVRELLGEIENVIYDLKTHEVVIQAEDDSAKAEITVKVNGKENNRVSIAFRNVYTYDPPTGDSSCLKLWIALLVVSQFALVGTAICFKKLKSAE